jgi:hypothetical protein
LDIDLSSQHWQDFCAILNEFALPRAILDFDHHTFMAWNSRFLEQTGFSANEMKSSTWDELLTLGDSWLPISDDRRGLQAEYVTCHARRPFGGHPAPGFVVRSHGKIGYAMLDVFDSSSAQFEQGRHAGREAERNRIVKAFHEEVSSSIIAALFLIETAKSELEEAGLPQAEAVSKASDILTETTEKIGQIIREADRNSQ